MKKLIKAGNFIGAGLIVIFVTLTISLLIAQQFTGTRIYTVTSNSMTPTFHRGDIALVKETPTSSLQVGEVVVFTPCVPNKPETAHRLTTFDSATSEFTTKGDANSAADPWECQFSEENTKVVAHTLPLLGNIWLQVRSENSINVLLVLAVAVLSLTALSKIWIPKKPVSSK